MGMSRKVPTEAEIAVLEALAAQGEILTAKAESGARPFRARLRFVDSARQFLILDRGADEAAAAALLARPRAEFLVEWGEWRIGFACDRPVTVSHDGTPAFRVSFPEAVSIGKRRMFARAAVPDKAKLRCVAYSGAAPIFEADITDVGQGGLGMHADAAVTSLEPGMILAGCRLERAGRTPAIVDLEIRHTARATLEDGRHVLRIGCRFVAPSPAAMGLVAEFIGERPPG